MLITRVEAPSTHTFYSSDIGVSDWISRNFDNRFEMQATMGYQNYAMLILASADHHVTCVPSSDDRQYAEQKNILGRSLEGKIERSSHEIHGAFTLSAEEDTIITVESLFLESMRGVRIYQEGGPNDYYKHFKDGTLHAVTCEDDGNGQRLVFTRGFHEALTYTAELSSETLRLEGSGDPAVPCRIRVSAGTHTLSVRIHMSGIWPDEDFSSFADLPIDILKPEYKELFDRLSNLEKDEVINQLQALHMLSRRTKLLAGGPRFFTYFGRDSLISISLLSGIVQSELTLHGIRSILERVSPNGEVAHEETLGEFSVLLHIQKKPGTAIQYVPEPVLEYFMVDDDFLLPAVIRRWLDREDPKMMHQMLKKKVHNGETGYEILARNLNYCCSQVERELVPYHQNVPVGDWRDSLAKQRVSYSYEVNYGLSKFFLQITDELFELLPELAQVFKTSEGSLLNDEAKRISLQEKVDIENQRFLVTESLEAGKDRVNDWLKRSNFSVEEIALLEGRLEKGLEGKNDYSYYAMALGRDKNPIRIQHNDVAFSFLYGYLSEEELDTMLLPLETEFPLGLRTDVGILVSNPLFCVDEDTRYGLNRSHYHGLVIWPFMHNVLYHGLLRQRDIFSDHKSVTDRIDALLEYLGSLTDHLGEFSASELLTFAPTENGDVPQPFGSVAGSRTESNPIQLWSSLGFTTHMERLIRD